ncbi:hypothetical protein CR513_38676, partial [Mucuna pruriens]
MILSINGNAYQKKHATQFLYEASNYDAPTNLFKADVSKPANSFTAASTASPSFTASSLLGACSNKLGSETIEFSNCFSTASPYSRKDLKARHKKLVPEVLLLDQSKPCFRHPFQKLLQKQLPILRGSLGPNDFSKLSDTCSLTMKDQGIIRELTRVNTPQQKGLQSETIVIFLRYKTKLVVKGYTQIFGIDYEEKFARDKNEYSDDKTKRLTLKESLTTHFEMKELEKLKYFLEIEVAYSKKDNFIFQKKYVLDLLKEIGKFGMQDYTVKRLTSSRTIAAIKAIKRFRLNSRPLKSTAADLQMKEIKGKLTAKKPPAPLPASTTIWKPSNGFSVDK